MWPFQCDQSWCERVGDVVAVVAPLGGVAQVVGQGVKVVGVKVGVTRD